LKRGWSVSRALSRSKRREAAVAPQPTTAPPLPWSAAPPTATPIRRHPHSRVAPLLAPKGQPAPAQAVGLGPRRFFDSQP
jgi:hypothetical protein